MAQPTIKTSFASGEWAPKLRSRVDIQKYHAGAALARNVYVDYSGGGLSTRPGTRFINQTKSAGARLIPFQPSSSISYTLEFGQNYIRFFSNGAPILESPIGGITGATTGGIITLTNTYNVGDWVFASGFNGLVGINGNYFIISAASPSSVTLTNLVGGSVTFTGAWTSGGELQRVHTIASPYATSDLFPNSVTGNPGLKWVQDVTSLIICHPSYAPQILTINSPANWSLSTITFAPTIGTPFISVFTSTLATGTFSYGYLVTAVDANGQESAPSAPEITGNALANIATTVGTNTLEWTIVPGARSYNVYKTIAGEGTNPPSGAQYGFIANVTGTTFIETTPGVAPDFSQTPPVSNNPFSGASVSEIIVNTAGTYTTSFPSVTIAPPTSGVTARAYAILVLNSATVANGGNNFNVGDFIYLAENITLQVTAVSLGVVSGFKVTNPGSLTSTIPSNPLPQLRTSGVGFGFTLTVNNWILTSIGLIDGGSGYTSAPAVTIPGTTTATAFLNPQSAGNPGVPGFFQERLVLAAQQFAIQSFNLSQPGSFFNFNVSNPTQSDDSISGTIISEELNDIRNLIPAPTGIIAFTGKGAWLINGGGGLSTANPITPSNVSALPQAFNGANDLRPLKINYDILFATNKGSYVRDFTYNIYANIYTGSDISIYSNHLFFGHNLIDWCWAEEPFKTVWAVRDDGILLSLGFVKEQELIGWTHHDTNGQFLSTCSVIETVNGNVVDAVYFIVQRLINGNLVQYVERLADRYFPYGYEDSWSVDCGLQTTPTVSATTTLSFVGNASAVGNTLTLTDTVGAPFTPTMASNNWILRAGGGIYKIVTYLSASQVTASVVRSPTVLDLYTSAPYPVVGYTIWQQTTIVSGLTQLIGQNVVGVADGTVVGVLSPLVVSASGTVSLPFAASKITLGLSFLPQIKTLPLDLGEPTVQSKRKKVPRIALRVADTLGLQVGTSFANVVTVKDFQIGAIPSQSNGPASVTDLVNPSWAPDQTLVDGYIVLDQVWQEPGQLCIQQNLPYPATILGIMPEVLVGDTK